MPLVGTHEITEEQIRDYVLRNNQGAIPYDALKAIAYDYLNKVIRKSQKFDKWPKDVKELCYSLGIRQDKDTGLPVYDSNGVTAWSSRARVAEDLLRDATHRIESLEETIRQLEDSKTLESVPRGFKPKGEDTPVPGTFKRITDCKDEP